MACFTKYFLFVFLYQICIPFTLTLQFNRNATGVVFSAYVRKVPVPGPIPNPEWQDYSLEDVKTMMQVISDKFSKVVTCGVGAKGGSFKENITYAQSYSQVYSGEAAALLNKEANDSVLSMLVGMWVSTSSSQMHSEVKVAFESARRANAIFPGTVWGLIFCENDIATRLPLATMTLKKLQKIKRDAQNANLKLGTRQNCEGISGDIGEEGTDENIQMRNIRREIVNMTDFIICTVGSNKEQLLDFREDFKTINPDIEVMGETGTSSSASTTDEASHLKKYWKMMDTWAEENNISIWMDEAFDNPWKHWSPYMGWWRLESNDQVGNVSGYVEKISSFKKKGKSGSTDSSTSNENNDNKSSKPDATDNESGTSIWVYVGIGIGILVALVIIVQLSLLYNRFNRLRDIFTKEEIKLFLHGASDESELRNMDTENGQIETAALSRPYDTSYEFSKDNLIIDWQCPLGSGEFGCVYKSCLCIPNEGNVEIALKLAKQDCPKNALKSLLSEIKILTYLGKHDNLVSIKGAYTAELQRGIVYVGTELCHLGSLKSYLKDIPNKPSPGNMNAYENSLGPKGYGATYLNTDTEIGITFLEMVQWAFEIACGMEYLGSKHVIHADLATRNVLLTTEKVAKITDFGLSRRLYDYTNYVKTQQEPLPWRWMSIEALKKLEFSSQSDVWSYGVTLWEIFSMGDVPYPGLSWTVDFVTCLENGLRMQQPSHASIEMFKLMSTCWEKEPQDRPSFSQLKFSTGEILGNNRKQ